MGEPRSGGETGDRRGWPTQTRWPPTRGRGVAGSPDMNGETWPVGAEGATGAQD